MNKKSIIIAIILIISFIIGVFAFKQSRFNGHTLVVHVKTLEKGRKYVTVENEIGIISRIGFEIGNDDGVPSFYVIPLPKTNLKTVTIPPLAGFGKYEIDRITLSNGAINYQWNAELICTQQFLKKNVHREACSNNFPNISLENDSSIVISSMPSSVSENTLGLRIIFASASIIIFYLCVVFLLYSIPLSRCENYRYILMARFAWLMVIAFYIYQFFVVYRFAVDIPFWEEWEFFDPDALPHGITWKWLFHHLGSNQQIMVFTKLVAWLDFKFFNLDFVNLKIFNYALFGGLLYVMNCFKVRVLGKETFRLFPVFLIFVVSPIAHEVHIASFLSGEHFVLLFFFLMVKYSIDSRISYKSTLIFSVLAIFAICSLAAGVILSVVILLCRTLYIRSEIFKNRINIKDGLQNIFLGGAIIGLSILLWFYGFDKPEGSQIWSLPNEARFWAKLFNLVGFGFGFENESPLPGAMCLMIVVLPIVLLMKNATIRWKKETYQILTASIGIIAVLCLITVGRGNMPYSIIISRYVLFSFLLIPLSSLAWWLALNNKKQRFIVLTLLWSLCLVSYWNNWDYSVYSDIQQNELLSLECVERYSSGEGDGLCGGTHSNPIGSYFDTARKMNVNFTKQFKR